MSSQQRLKDAAWLPFTLSYSMISVCCNHDNNSCLHSLTQIDPPLFLACSVRPAETRPVGCLCCSAGSVLSASTPVVQWLSHNDKMTINGSKHYVMCAVDCYNNRACAALRRLNCNWQPNCRQKGCLPYIEHFPKKHYCIFRIFENKSCLKSLLEHIGPLNESPRASETDVEEFVRLV